MMANYTIDGLVWSSSKFFYLFNWRLQNTVSLYGYDYEDRLHKANSLCIGMWKIKNKK